MTNRTKKTASNAEAQIFLGPEQSGELYFNTVNAVLRLHGAIAAELRDWPPSLRDLAARTLADISKEIREAAGK